MLLRFYKILAIILMIFIIGCEQIPSDTIEIKMADYVVENITAPSEFVYSNTNKVLSVSVLINNSESIKNVWFNLETENGSEIISSYNYMTSPDKSGSKTFAGETTISEDLLSGNYIINIYIEDNVNPSGENTKKIGSKKLSYLSEAENFAPVISNLNIPSKVKLNVSFVFSFKVEDQNGSSDISSVYYKLYDPEGKLKSNSQGISEFPLYDDGNTLIHSDEVAGDGIYTTNLAFPLTAVTGKWEFKFNAVDNSGAISNTISYKIQVTNE
jgi:hypothetical protein